MRYSNAFLNRKSHGRASDATAHHALSRGPHTQQSRKPFTRDRW